MGKPWCCWKVLEAHILYNYRDQNESLELRGQRTRSKVVQEETEEVNMVMIKKVLSCVKEFIL